jgi:hypothetical protein
MAGFPSIPPQSRIMLQTPFVDFDQVRPGGEGGKGTHWHAALRRHFLQAPLKPLLRRIVFWTGGQKALAPLRNFLIRWLSTVGLHPCQQVLIHSAGQHYLCRSTESAATNIPCNATAIRINFLFGSRSFKLAPPPPKPPSWDLVRTYAPCTISLSEDDRDSYTLLIRESDSLESNLCANSLRRLQKHEGLWHVLGQILAQLPDQRTENIRD